MTPKQFDQYAALTRMKSSAIGMARAVLIDGETYAAAGARFGCTRQAAYRAVQRIEAVARELKGQKWETVTVRLPRKLADHVLELEREAVRG